MYSTVTLETARSQYRRLGTSEMADDKNTSLGQEMIDVVIPISHSEKPPTACDNGVEKPTRVPKRILHFCDGTLEEYSTDEDDEDENDAKKRTENLIDPKTLTWIPWFWYYTVTSGSKALQACDYVGESLANFFGITSPKYHFEIEEYKRSIAEEEKAREKRDIESKGWSETIDQDEVITTEAEVVATQQPAIIQYSEHM